MTIEIEAAKRGEQSACEYIVRQFTGMALTVAYERLRDAHLAEDAVQEAFAEAFMNLHKLQQQEAFPGWFKVILERQCSRMLRRKRHPSVPIHEWGQIAGYSILEISSCLGVSVSTLKKRLFDARRMLKKSLHVADFISVFHDLYEGGTGMLHIVNGDSVAEKLKKGVIKERFWYGEKYILMVPYFDIWMRLRIEDSGRSIWNRL